MNANVKLLDLFLDGRFPKFECPQCEFTFLTNVYLPSVNQPACDEAQQLKQLGRELLPEAGSDADFILIEKRALGLEYFQQAVNKYAIKHAPLTHRIAVLAEDEDRILDDSVIQLDSGDEPDYRLLYLMERLEHLDKKDETFFTDFIHDLDWRNEVQRHACLESLSQQYGESLAHDIRMLCRYFREHDEFIKWDLHGENLMRRPSTKELVILDPYTMNY